ncbi:MAG TPA: hypothetical protein VG756_13690 [Pseudonocardiaceae bacterium]|nr:hypothetical protein [Pseudonocardiaceae bacterium]
MSRTSSRLVTAALVLILGCLTLSAVSADASPLGKHHVKLSAGPVKSRVHKGDQVRIHGHMASAPDTTGRALMAATDTSATLYLQEETQAGVWVNLADTNCRPDNDFDIGLRLNVSATLSLRVFAPETALYASATSSVFALVVL